ncbi:MAG: hypothetical protein U5N26_03130 [Candidatus Marinimicrobia bacterium]|nr:hypothetical protein [Candidatus Neomarinimicrobiota bacterium]
MLRFSSVMVTVNGLANGLPIKLQASWRSLRAISQSVRSRGIDLFDLGLDTLYRWLSFVANNLSLSLTGKTGVLIPVKAQIAFSLSCLFNAGWIFLRHCEAGISFHSCSCWACWPALSICSSISSRTNIKDIRSRVAVLLPVSIYLGWISVATIANVTALLVSLRPGGAWGLPKMSGRSY